MTPSRTAAIASATAWFDAGSLQAELRRRVAFPTESQNAERAQTLVAYLTDEIAPSVERLGFAWQLWPNPVTGAPPMLFAERHEGGSLPTVLIYGHGDVVAGYDAQWSDGRSPWELSAIDGKWYGRGTADNKGQHTINLAALGRVLEERGQLGFNAKLLLEMGEEIGSPGLHRACEQGAARLSADVLIASDGPRLASDRSTIFLGSRGAFNFDLDVALRDGGHHSGNWGGLLANPGTILAGAIASMVDGRGRILVDALRPAPIPDSVRRALALIEPGEAGGPQIDADWGEPRLSPAERSLAGTRWKCSPFAPAIRASGQRHSATRQRAYAGPLRRRMRLAHVHSGDTRASGRARIFSGGGAPGERGANGGDTAGSGKSLGALGERIDRVHDRCAARDLAQPRRIAAQRLLRRGARPADDLGAPLLSGLLATCAQ
jgi:acetylornithine deacetylase/succinyl-diaminopimelate desuccinylase-like protein